MLEKSRGVVKAVFTFFYSIFAWLLDKVVARVYLNKILFNCAWEDPRLDLEALKLTEEDNILIITTAGCNVLSLALNSPKHIYSIDRNICQNALLELKIAAIREFDYSTFWKLFGTGRLANFSKLHYPRLRQHLSPLLVPSGTSMRITSTARDLGLPSTGGAAVASWPGSFGATSASSA